MPLLGFDDARRAEIRDDLSQAAIKVSATQATAATPLVGGSTYRLVNTGAAIVYVRSGTSAVVAVDTTGHPILASGEALLKVAGETHLATICASGESTTLYICPVSEA